jgi:hypothetical protein
VGKASAGKRRRLPISFAERRRLNAPGRTASGSIPMGQGEEPVFSEREGRLNVCSPIFRGLCYTPYTNAYQQPPFAGPIPAHPTTIHPQQSNLFSISSPLPTNSTNPYPITTNNQPPPTSGSATHCRLRQQEWDRGGGRESIGELWEQRTGWVQRQGEGKQERLQW